MRTQIKISSLILIAIIFTVISERISAQPAILSGSAHISNAIPLATQTLQVESTPMARTAPPLSLTLTLLCICLMLLLVVGVFILGFIVRRPNRDAPLDEKL